jgi:hypothetical protein
MIRLNSVTAGHVASNQRVPDIASLINEIVELIDDNDAVGAADTILHLRLDVSLHVLEVSWACKMHFGAHPYSLPKYWKQQLSLFSHLADIDLYRQPAGHCWCWRQGQLSYSAVAASSNTEPGCHMIIQNIFHHCPARRQDLNQLARSALDMSSRVALCHFHRPWKFHWKGIRNIAPFSATYSAASTVAQWVIRNKRVCALEHYALHDVPLYDMTVLHIRDEGMPPKRHAKHSLHQVPEVPRWLRVHGKFLPPAALLLRVPALKSLMNRKGIGWIGTLSNEHCLESAIDGMVSWIAANIPLSTPAIPARLEAKPTPRKRSPAAFKSPNSHKHVEHKSSSSDKVFSLLIPLKNGHPMDLHCLRSASLVGQFSHAVLVARSVWGVGNHHSHACLLLVDQHAASERIHCERIQQDLQAGSLTFSCLPCRPVVDLSRYLTPEAALTLEQHRMQLEQVGWRWLCTADKWQVTATPILASSQRIPPISLLQIAQDASAWPRISRAAVADLACKTAIKNGDPLTPSQCQSLMTALVGCRAPFACAHGRPSCCRRPLSMLASPLPSQPVRLT